MIMLKVRVDMNCKKTMIDVVEETRFVRVRNAEFKLACTGIT